MSLAAIGCNPSFKWSLDANGVVGGDNPDHAQKLGTLGFSPSGGMYVVLQAMGAVAKGGFCLLKGRFEAQPATTTLATHAFSCAIPQIALADDEYGWGLVWGEGDVIGAAIAAAATELSTSGTAGRVDDQDSAGRIGGLVPLNSAVTTAGDLVPVAVTWPRINIIS